MRAACLFAMFALTLLFTPCSASTYSINFGQTVNGTLNSSSGPSPDLGTGHYADLYSFYATAGQTVSISLSSNAPNTFNPAVYLRNSNTAVASNYNTSGPSTAFYYTIPSNGSGTYTIDATTYYANAMGAYSITLNLYGSSGTPAAPTNLTATTGNAVVNLSWTASANGANSYNVQRATVTGGPYTTVGTATGTSYPDTTVSNGPTYYYVVSGVNGYGTGANSTEAIAMPPPPAAPTGLVGTPSSKSVALQWNSSGGGATYVIYRNPGGQIGTAPAAFQTGTYQDNSPVNGTTYTYYVVAVDRYGQNSTPSNSVTVTPLAPVYQGNLEAANDNGITGWALDSTQPNSTVSVTITSDGYYNSVPANVYRSDHGAHGFSVPTFNTNFQDGHPHVIHVYYPNNVELPNSPLTYQYVPVDGATCSAPSRMPTTIRAGQTYPVSVTVQNTGNTKWPANGVYQLLSQNPNNNNNWGVQTVNVPADVAPGTSVVFNFNVTAPSVPGTYNFQWQMIHQGVGTFGSPTPNVVCANPADDAAFVSQTAPPTTIRVGQSYPVSVIMKNMGTNAWPANSSYQLVSQNPNNNNFWSVQTVTVPTAVAPGASVTFTFNVTAPSLPGVYNFQWCMVHQGVALFGDFTQNVVCMNPPDAAAFVLQTPPPATIRAGQPYQVSVTMRNNGTNTWATAGAYQLLSQNPNNNNWWSVQTVNVPANVVPGASVTFAFTAVAPSLPGAYNFQWQMIHQGIGTFGDMTPNVPCANPPDAAAFVSQTPPPPSIRAGQPYQTQVTMRNIGINTWATDGSYALNSQNPVNNNWWGVQLVNPPASVAPGAQVTFTINTIAPSTTLPGTYNFQWQMLHQGVSLFGDMTPNVVCMNPPDDAAFVSQTTPPSTVGPGQGYQVSVTMQNTGTATWPANSAYQLLSQNPNNNAWWHVQTVPLSAAVSPGGQATFSFTVTAPAANSTHNYQWQMIHQGIGVFGDPTPNDVITVSQSPPVLEAASTDQALSATPSYFSGTGCNVFAAASPINGYITHAQIWINNILIGEYDDTNTTPFSTDPTLVHTYGSNQPRTNMSILFDSTHFADGTPLPIKLQVWDSTGQNGYVTIIAPVYNKAYVLEDLRLPLAGTVTANVVSHTQAMNLYTISSAGDKNTIISALPTYTVFYAWTHAGFDTFQHTAFGEGDAYTPDQYTGPGQSWVDYYVFSQDVQPPVSRKASNSLPPYNFVFVDGCEGATYDDLAKAFFGLTANQSTGILMDQAYFSFLDTPVADQHNADWTNQVWQNLQQGMNIDDARNAASAGNAYPHYYVPDGFGGATEVKARTQVLGDKFTRVHGVYLAITPGKWFK